MGDDYRTAECKSPAGEGGAVVIWSALVPITRAFLLKPSRNQRGSIRRSTHPTIRILSRVQRASRAICLNWRRAAPSATYLNDWPVAGNLLAISVTVESRLEYCDQSQHPDRAADRRAARDGQKQPADVQAMFFRIAASLFSHRLISPVRGFGVNPLSTDAVSQPAAALCACP